jgi:hypothetical protein
VRGKIFFNMPFGGGFRRLYRRGWGMQILLPPRLVRSAEKSQQEKDFFHEECFEDLSTINLYSTVFLVKYFWLR